MAWGTNKFFKKLIKPNAIANNELADFISRVPDNEELVSFQNYTHFPGRNNKLTNGNNLGIYPILERYSRASIAGRCCQSKVANQKETCCRR